MKLGRLWFTLCYALATLVAPGLHDHDRVQEVSAPLSRGDCDEPAPHVADHEVADPGPAPAPCPSCQLRAQPSLTNHAASMAPEPVLSANDPVADASPRDGMPVRARSRAPPRA